MKKKAISQAEIIKSAATAIVLAILGQYVLKILIESVFISYTIKQFQRRLDNKKRQHRTFGK